MGASVCAGSCMCGCSEVCAWETVYDRRWVLACNTTGCSCIISGEKKPTITEERYTLKQHSRVRYKFYENWAPFTAKIAEFVMFYWICKCSTGAKNTNGLAEHKKQQPHNEAVNKEDVSTSLCFPANKQNGFWTPFRGKLYERENQKQPDCSLWKASREYFKRKHPPALTDGGLVLLVWVLLNLTRATS